jgi:hypothetical protein
MEAWMKQDLIDKKMVTSQVLNQNKYQSVAKEALQITMGKYVSVVNCQKGHGLKHVKTHSVLHVPDDVLWFGSPNNWNSARLESGHKFHAKAPAQMTQLRKDRLEEQVSPAQTTNLLALDMASDLILKSKQYLVNEGIQSQTLSRNSQDVEVENGGSRFVVKVMQLGNSCSAEWIDNAKARSKIKSKTRMACEALVFLRVIHTISK